MDRREHTEASRVTRVTSDSDHAHTCNSSRHLRHLFTDLKGRSHSTAGSRPAGHFSEVRVGLLLVSTQCNYKGRRLPVWGPRGHGTEGLLLTTADLISLHTHTKHILLGVSGRAAVHSDTHSGHRTRSEPTLRGESRWLGTALLSLLWSPRSRLTPWVLAFQFCPVIQTLSLSSG